MNKPKSYWSNDDLSEYFENVPADEFSKYAVTGGIDEGCDIEIIYPFITQVAILIEVGACYGRVIDHLIRKGFGGKIFAIERSKKFCELLEKKFYSEKNISIIHADIKNYSPRETVDCVLWMWSDIASFSPDEQPKTVMLLKKWLKPKGTLVIEALLHTQSSLNATHVFNDGTKMGQNYIIESSYGTLYGYIPTEQEIISYALSAGLTQINKINYNTKTGRARVIYFFENSITSEN